MGLVQYLTKGSRVDEKSLREAFGDCGEILACQVNNWKDYVRGPRIVITFADAESHEKAARSQGELIEAAEKQFAEAQFALHHARAEEAEAESVDAKTDTPAE